MVRVTLHLGKDESCKTALSKPKAKDKPTSVHGSELML